MSHPIFSASYSFLTYSTYLKVMFASVYVYSCVMYQSNEACAVLVSKHSSGTRLWLASGSVGSHGMSIPALASPPVPQPSCP